MKKFKGIHFPDAIVMLILYHYFGFSLSYRNVKTLMKMRGISIDHPTIQRWAIKFEPLLEKAFKRKKKAVGSRWHMDETYLKIKGKQYFYYRAIDEQAQTIDFYLSPTRNKQAALTFLKKAINSNEIPSSVNMDKSSANYSAIKIVNKQLPKDKTIEIRRIKYGNNIIEQDHRTVKRKHKMSMGFNSFQGACNTLKGIEVVHMLRKGQGRIYPSSPVWRQFYALME